VNARVPDYRRPDLGKLLLLAEMSLRRNEVGRCLTQRAQHLVSIGRRHERTMCDRDDLNAANVVYEVNLAGSAAPKMEKSATSFGVELEAFEIAKVALLPGDGLELKTIPEDGGELTLSALAPGEQRIHGFKVAQSTSPKAAVGLRLNVAGCRPRAAGRLGDS